MTIELAKKVSPTIQNCRYRASNAGHIRGTEEDTHINNDNNDLQIFLQFNFKRCILVSFYKTSVAKLDSRFNVKKLKANKCLFKHPSGILSAATYSTTSGGIPSPVQVGTLAACSTDSVSWTGTLPSHGIADFVVP